MAKLCFICELPLLPHQTWSVWRESDRLTASGATSGGNYVHTHYHEDCLSCSVCGLRLKQGETNNARRYGSKIYCALHYADISGVGTGGTEFMAKLKDFKRQSLGYAEARRKSSTTLTFPVPVQACPGLPYCSDYPHGIKTTSGYWIECRRPASTASIRPGEDKIEKVREQEDKDARDREAAKKANEASLLMPVHAIPRSTSAEVFNIRGQFERSDTSKSTNDMSPYVTIQPPSIQIIDSYSHKSKDDIELYRRQPNIVITSVHSSSHQHTATDIPNEPQTPSLPSTQLPSHQIPLVIEQSLIDEEKPSKSEDPYELISFQEEIYEKHYYGREHWNYFTNDEGLGPVILSLKQEMVGGRDQFRVLLRTVSYSLHGLVPASSICADRYDREAVVKALGDEAGLKPQLCLGQLPSIPDELIKLDQVFVKSELKVGVIYIKEGQTSEEAILGNRSESPLFAEFLELLGDRVRLRGFDKYKGGLDTVHDLTGTESVYTNWKNIELMFHVSTMLPHEENDPQKLQKKRHIGNDIVCVAFMEADDTPFCPGCVKSHFLHAFIVVRTSPRPVPEGDNRRYSVSIVCRDEVSAFKPYLWHESLFEKGPHFREWLLTKIVNGERASYSAPKFARMQDRTRSQMLEDLVTNLTNHIVTGQIPKPYRRGSWRPIGHMRPSSPLLDSVRDLFECYDQLAKDFSNAFNSNAKMICDVAFNVMGNAANGCHDRHIRRIYGVRAILAIRSRVFLEMLYGFTPPGTVKSTNQHNLPGTGTESNAINRTLQASPERPKPVRKSSLTASTIHKITQIPKIIHPSDSKNKRKESSVSNISGGSARTPTYLQVPGSSTLAGGFKSAFSRLISGNWSGWGSKNRDSMKRWQSESIYGRVEGNGENSEIPGLSVCADVAKIDRTKLAQTEFTIIEFDGNTFQLLIEYLHSGSCPLTCDTIPGLICAAEHFDLPDLLQACFHHTKTHLRLSVVPSMLNQLENYYWRYNSATQLVNTILKFVDTRVTRFFSRSEYLTLSESMISNILTRPNLDITEICKFQIMYQWALNKVINNGQLDSTKEPLSSDCIPPNKFGELKAIMNRLTRDLQFHKIVPQDLIKIVLPSKTITHERILATLLFQADSGLYRSPNYTAFGS